MSDIPKYGFKFKILTVYTHETSLSVEYIKDGDKERHFRKVHYNPALVAAGEVSTSEYITALIEKSAPHDIWTSVSPEVDSEILGMVNDGQISSDENRVLAAQDTLDEMEGLVTNNPTASFTFEVSGREVSFSNTTPGIEAETPTIWNMGDGEILNRANIGTYEYASAGTYVVNLTVEIDGSVLTNQSSVTVI